MGRKKGSDLQCIRKLRARRIGEQLAEEGDQEEKRPADEDSDEGEKWPADANEAGESSDIETSDQLSAKEQTKKRLPVNVSTSGVKDSTTTRVEEDQGESETVNDNPYPPRRGNSHGDYAHTTFGLDNTDAGTAAGRVMMADGREKVTDSYACSTRHAVITSVTSMLIARIYDLEVWSECVC